MTTFLLPVSTPARSAVMVRTASLNPMRGGRRVAGMGRRRGGDRQVAGSTSSGRYRSARHARNRRAPRTRAMTPVLCPGPIRRVCRLLLERVLTELSLGPEQLRVSAVGLGCMGMSDLYGPADRDESSATIHAALDAGVTLLDTGDFYGMGHNELLIADALAGRPRDEVLISVKFGAQRGPDGSWLGYDASPPAVKTALADSLQRLRTDHIDVYRPARLDQKVPIEETIGAIAELVQSGYVRYIGLSELGPDTIRRAAA